MNRKEIAGSLFVATSFFVFGWIAHSQTMHTPKETTAKPPELWQPESLRKECKQTLDDIFKNTETAKNCRTAVGRVVDAPNGACRGYGSLALQNVVCKKKPQEATVSQATEPDKISAEAPSIAAPIPIGAAPPLPAIIQSNPANPGLPNGITPIVYPSWLSPYCVDTLRELKIEDLNTKECLQSLNKASDRSAGGCRYDYVMRFANEICPEFTKDDGSKGDASTKSPSEATVNPSKEPLRE